MGMPFHRDRHVPVDVVLGDLLQLLKQFQISELSGHQISTPETAAGMSGALMAVDSANGWSA
jgi:hypothetical protein